MCPGSHAHGYSQVNSPNRRTSRSRGAIMSSRSPAPSAGHASPKLAGGVEHRRPRGNGDGARASAGPLDRQGGQGLVLAVPLVGGEAVHVPAAQDGRVVTAARSSN
jgi:hypothetical protein